jgi:hypothetical protein
MFERQGRICNHALRELYDDISTTINQFCYITNIGHLLRALLIIYMLYGLNDALLKLPMH